MPIKTETFAIPDFYLSALLNGDNSGIEDADIAALDAFIDDNLKKY